MTKYPEFTLAAIQAAPEHRIIGSLKHRAQSTFPLSLIPIRIRDRSLKVGSKTGSVT
jgi:hypothetical protein